MHNLQSAAAAEIIRSGDILHARTQSPTGAMIRRAIGSQGNHDAILVRPENDLCVGECIWPRAACTPLADYDRAIAACTSQVVILRPVKVTATQASLAAAWWLRTVEGKPYDLGAYPRLILKSIVGDLCPWPAGWEWAWYCTESCRDAYLHGPSLDLWNKNNPTPRTTEKRLAAGVFAVVWSSSFAFNLTVPNFTPSPNPVGVA